MADLSIDQWVALNDEIAALVRAGLPLERGLLGVGDDFRGRLGRVASALGRRLEQGASLPEALAAEGDRVPPVYRAVVEAGSRSGSLAAALEGLADYARGYAELRRALGLALFYPLIVLSMAFVLFIGFLVVLVPIFASIFQDFRLPGPRGLSVLAYLGSTAWYWWPIGPVALVVLLVSWRWTGRASSFPGGGAPLRWVPWVRDLLRLSAWTGFAKLLALLVEHGVPLPLAIELAGRSSGDRALARSSRSLASQIEEGHPELETGVLPPMVAWVLRRGRADGLLVQSLRQAAESYKRRALLQAELVRTTLPVAILVAVGAASVLLYGLMLFVPMTTLLRQLSDHMG
jgi:general secretion pathway protein F